jgi:hypothetical protein
VKNDKYILDAEGRPQPVDDLIAWARWFENADRIVKQDFAEGSEGRVGVSTIFLGLDHNYSGRGGPILWESLVFGTSLDGEMQRYRSKAEAIRGHEALVRRVSEAWQQEHGGV